MSKRLQPACLKDLARCGRPQPSLCRLACFAPESPGAPFKEIEHERALAVVGHLPAGAGLVLPQASEFCPEKLLSRGHHSSFLGSAPGLASRAAGQGTP